MSGDLIRIDAPHFVAGVIVQDGRVIDAAPIVRWMRGKSVGFVQDYCRSKRWQCVVGKPVEIVRIGGEG